MIPIIIEIEGPKAHVVGYLPDDVVRYLRQELSFKVDGAFFAEAYEQGRWDGRKYLFTENGHVFATGLVSRVAASLRIIGYDATVVDSRPLSDPQHFMPVRIAEQLYDFQRNAVDQAIYYRNGMLRIATGGGKTRVGSALISEL